MTPLTKNVLTILGVLTIGYAGYYFYTQQASSLEGGVGQEDAVYQNMLANTEVFIVRSQELSQINLDTSVLDDPRFRSLQAFTRPVEDQPVGKQNPFSESQSSTFINFDSE
jgi:uncharacterized protein HemX